MSEVHTVSLKLGASHGLWQYKISGTHEKVMMHGLRRLLDAACRLLGFDHADRSVVYLFSFSAEPFQGWQFGLERVREEPSPQAKGCYYKVKESQIGTFAGTGFFPGMILKTYLHSWPARIYFKLEKSLTGEIVN